ncbi:MAG: thiamine pyrophosphate-dependent enzyme [Candidatus Bathyarchaeota archaeon]|jgi:2-oxoglutarate ferredoxin oxidoreductase subunit beta
MTTVKDLTTDQKIFWCPGCGNFGILNAMRRALAELGLRADQITAVTGIGCHGKMTNYLNVNGFHVIHGRVLPVATAIKLSNTEQTVIGFSGDGDCFGIGLGHFPHAARRNPDLTLVVHDNLIYGLTTGQTSPTTRRGHITKTTPRGAFEEAVNPISTALASNAAFVARGYVGDLDHLSGLFKEALEFRGFAMVDVLQPCIAWNRVNTYKFYNDRVYKIGETDHDPSDLMQAYEKAEEWTERIPIGVIYRRERPPYREYFPFLKGDPLVRRGTDADISELMKEFS